MSDILSYNDPLFVPQELKDKARANGKFHRWMKKDEKGHKFRAKANALGATAVENYPEHYDLKLMEVPLKAREEHQKAVKADTDEMMASNREANEFGDLHRSITRGREPRMTDSRIRQVGSSPGDVVGRSFTCPVNIVDGVVKK